MHLHRARVGRLEPACDDRRARRWCWRCRRLRLRSYTCSFSGSIPVCRAASYAVVAPAHHASAPRSGRPADLHVRRAGRPIGRAPDRDPRPGGRVLTVGRGGRAGPVPGQRPDRDERGPGGRRDHGRAASPGSPWPILTQRGQTGRGRIGGASSSRCSEWCRPSSARSPTRTTRRGRRRGRRAVPPGARAHGGPAGAEPSMIES